MSVECSKTGPCCYLLLLLLLLLLLSTPAPAAPLCLRRPSVRPAPAGPCHHVPAAWPRCSPATPACTPTSQASLLLPTPLPPMVPHQGASPLLQVLRPPASCLLLEPSCVCFSTPYSCFPPSTRIEDHGRDRGRDAVLQASSPGLYFSGLLSFSYSVLLTPDSPLPRPPNSQSQSQWPSQEGEWPTSTQPSTTSATLA